jgi:hypothetical protein
MDYEKAWSMLKNEMSESIEYLKTREPNIKEGSMDLNKAMSEISVCVLKAMERIEKTISR